jgi:CBS domain-containing protein
MSHLHHLQARYWRDQLVAARDAAFRDAERFQDVLFTLEKLGQFLSGKTGTLASYKSAIKRLASQSCLAHEVPSSHRGWHTPFGDLYELVRQARNEAMHQGAYARHLTDHAVRLSLILEDALMTGRSTASEFMVSNPVVAFPWQPISYVREQMLTHGFSFLPVRVSELAGPEWWLLAEYAVTKYLRAFNDESQRKKRLATRIEEAISSKELELLPALICSPHSSVEDVVSKFDGRPVLVVDQSNPDVLIGIITAFDLM